MGRRAEIELLEHLEFRLKRHTHTEDQVHYLSRKDVNTLVRWGNIALNLSKVHADGDIYDPDCVICIGPKEWLRKREDGE